MNLPLSRRHLLSGTALLAGTAATGLLPVAAQVSRDELDPKKIANRDKMFPTGEGEPTGLYGLHPLEKAGIISRM